MEENENQLTENYISKEEMEFALASIEQSLKEIELGLVSTHEDVMARVRKKFLNTSPPARQAGQPLQSPPPTSAARKHIPQG